MSVALRNRTERRNKPRRARLFTPSKSGTVGTLLAFAAVGIRRSTQKLRSVVSKGLIQARGKRSQEEVAWGAGISKAMLSLLESGAKAPSLPVLFALAKELGVELTDLVPVRARDPRVALFRMRRGADRAVLAEVLSRARELLAAPDRDRPRAQ